MKVFHAAQALHHHLLSLAPSIGFVPTMGALHEGHLSLIRQSKAQHKTTVCSIYVNPTQFNDPKDLEKYPKPIERDLQLLAESGCDIVFLPTYDEIYPSADILERSYNLEGLDMPWEGSNRPGHFRGVCLVVHRLLEIVPCQTLYLGQKDFKQWRILHFMVNHILQWPIEVQRCPIIREPDGLAMSSRNIRLSPQERQDSLVLHLALQKIVQAYPQKPLPKALAEGLELLHTASTLQKIDYLAVADSNTLEPVSEWTTQRELVVLVAAHFQHARLIDNMMLTTH